MTINEEIYGQLETVNIENKNAAIIYLLSVYYKIDATNVIDNDTITQVNLSKIVERDYSKKTLKWNIPLFTSDLFVVEDNWAWVLDEYRKMWMDIKGSKGGDKATCIKKMKDFFSKHPELRKDDILNAAAFYTGEFKSGNNPKYMIEADNFIYKLVDKVNRSKLEQVLEQFIINKAEKINELNRYDGKIR